MEQTEALKLFQEADALMQGHFLLSSGLHSGQYLQCARVLEHPAVAEKLCQALAKNFQGDKVSAVIGPAMGGIVIAYELARALGARALFAERQDGKMALRRGFCLGAQDTVLVAEDVITTGGSVREVIELIKATGAKIIAVAVLADRGAGKIDFGLRCVSLLKVDITSYPADNCPLCQKNIPVVKPGSRS